MRESNAIEGEWVIEPEPIRGITGLGILHNNDVEACRWFLSLEDITEGDLWKLHLTLYIQEPALNNRQLLQKLFH